MENLDVKKIIIISILLIFIAFGSGILVGKTIFNKPEEIQINQKHKNK